MHHYDVNIQPDKCPRKVNREIIETMVQAYSKLFGQIKPVFDGRNNLYTRDPLPIGNDRVDLEVTLPGEGKDRVFRVTIKWVAQVSLSALEEALEGRTRQIPFDAILVLILISLCYYGSHEINFSGTRCGDEAFAIYDLYPRRSQLFLVARRLLPSSRRRPRSVVWFPSVRSSFPMEDDVEHRW